MKHLATETRRSAYGYERSFPVTTRIVWENTSVHVAAESRDGETIFRISLEMLPGPETVGDILGARENFLAVSDEIQARNFLAANGGFRFSSWELLQSPKELTWRSFVDYQKLVRFLMVNGFLYDGSAKKSRIKNNIPEDLQGIIDSVGSEVEDWVHGDPGARLHFDEAFTKAESTALVIDTPSALEAIIASVYLDHRAGDNFRICKLAGCEVVFSMRGQRADKFFCTTDHARHHSIRTSRARRKPPNCEQRSQQPREAPPMANRRGSGEGSIYQRKDGRWCAQVSLGYKPGGKPHRKLIYGKTRLDVSEAMKRTLREQQLGLTVTSERQTLTQYLTDWLENTVKPKNKQLTHRSYEWIVRIHLIPGLGKVPLVKLTPQKLQAFINERHASGLSPASVKHINATLRAALSQAQRWQLVHQNAVKLITLPRAVRYQAAILTPAESKTLLTYLIGHSLETLFTVALTMGLRRGELLGLRWCDLDLSTATMNVRHSLERVKGKGLTLAEPKSERAKRDLRIPQVALTSLAGHQVRQRAAREWAGKKWKDGGFVFTTSLGTPLPPDTISKAFPLALKAAKLPRVRFHDLRHSCASLLLSIGVSAKLVQETLGHSTYQLTMDTYSHMIPALRNEVADKMDEVFASTVNEAVKPDNPLVN